MTECTECKKQRQRRAWWDAPASAPEASTCEQVRAGAETTRCEQAQRQSGASRRRENLVRDSARGKALPGPVSSPVSPCQTCTSRNMVLLSKAGAGSTWRRSRSRPRPRPCPRRRTAGGTVARRSLAVGSRATCGRRGAAARGPLLLSPYISRPVRSPAA